MGIDWIATRTVAVLLVGVGCLAGGPVVDPAFGKPPNIVLVLTDDQGWSQMSAPADPRTPQAQSAYLETPNMARLVREGLRFTSGYSPAPLCTPTRRSILCGTGAARSGTEFRSRWVPAEHTTIPKALKAAHPDYRCAHFGKWGEQMISTPEECGYDVSDGMTGNNTGGMPATLGVKGSHEAGPPYFVDNDDPKRTRSLTDRAVGFMTEQAKAGRPFYAQVSYYAAHLSVVARQETISKFDKKGTPDRGYTPAWAAMLEELDTGLGRLLAAIDELGIAENTYVVFTADNGGRGTVPGGDAGRLPTNHPLTGAKHSLNEGGIRVPFIIRGPGIAAGSVCHTPVVGYDLLPTFYDLAGGQAALAGEIDGVSLRPLLGNPDATLSRPQQAVFFHRPQRRVSAVRQGDYKLLLTWEPNGQVRSRSLYDLNPDPREDGRDIAEQEPERAEAMQALLLRHLESVDAESAEDGEARPAKKRKRAARRPSR
jgi:arylsulfatase A-like enzyme